MTTPRHPLDAIFAPRSVAVIGATDKPGSVGRTVVSNLLHSQFGGAVYPVNPKRSNVLGVPCWPDVRAVPSAVDLAGNRHGGRRSRTSAGRSCATRTAPGE